MFVCAHVCVCVCACTCACVFVFVCVFVSSIISYTNWGLHNIRQHHTGHWEHLDGEEMMIILRNDR